MKELAHLPQTMQRSGIREILEIAVRTPGCIRLEIGEPDFPTPAHIVEAAAKAARDGHTKYTLTGGIIPLREALIEKMATFNKLEDLAVENVLVTPGSSVAILAVVQALINPGDEVLLPDPAWPTYANQVLMVGGVPKFYPTHAAQGFVPYLAELEASITPRSKLLVLCNPSNPTGAVYPRAVVEGMVELARKYDLYVISDEVYEQLIFQGQPTTAAALASERVFSTYSFSKTYSMTGWRIGYVVGQQPAIGMVSKALEVNVSCTAEPVQYAALAALHGPQDVIETMRLGYLRRRDLVCDLLKQRGLFEYEPEGAFYIMVNIGRTGMDGYTFSKALLTEQKVATAPGGTFGPGSADYVRVSLATAEDALLEGVTRLCNYVEQHSVVGSR